MVLVKMGGSQLLFLRITIGIAIRSSIMTGIIKNILGNIPTYLFEDSTALHIPKVRYEDV